MSRYYTKPLLDCNERSWGLYDSQTERSITWGCRRDMDERCREMNQKESEKEGKE